MKGNVASRRDLDLAFARADLALAGHYRSMADKALADRDRADAARWLKAAGDSVDEAAAWTGRSPSGAQTEVWDQMHAVQTKIRADANWSYDDAKKGTGYLGTQIQYLGQQMQNFRHLRQQKQRELSERQTVNSAALLFRHIDGEIGQRVCSYSQPAPSVPVSPSYNNSLHRAAPRLFACTLLGVAYRLSCDMLY